MEVRDGEGKSALITYEKGNSFLSPIPPHSQSSFSGGGNFAARLFIKSAIRQWRKFPSSFLFLSLSLSLSLTHPFSVAEREGWREGTPPFRHLDDCGGRIELQRKLIRRRADSCTEEERGGWKGGGGWQLVATLSLHDREPGFLSASTGLLNFRRNSGREIRFSQAVPRNLLLD